MGEKGLGLAEGRGLKRTVLLGAEPVCWSAAFTHVVSQGCEWALPSPAPLPVRTGPFPPLPWFS